MPSIPADLAGYAAQAASLTGLDKNVVLSQWISENGWTAPASNNFGNIRYNPGANSALWAGIVGNPQPGDFVTYQSPEAGLKAYAALINTDPNYTGIRASVGLPAKNQLDAIIFSPWDSGHYNGGKLLTGVYNSVTGANITPVAATPNTAPNPAGTAQDSTLARAFFIILGGGLVLLGVKVMTDVPIIVGGGDHAEA